MDINDLKVKLLDEIEKFLDEIGYQSEAEYSGDVDTKEPLDYYNVVDFVDRLRNIVLE